MPARSSLALCLILLVFQACSSGKERAADSGYADLVPVVDRVMQKLDDLTANRKIKSNIAAQSIRTSLKAILGGKLHLSIAPELPPSVLTGIGFQFEAGTPGFAPSLVINPKVLASYDRNPSIILSAFAHEMQHAADFFRDPEYYVRVSNNIFERYLFELDAYFTEAVFIDQYLLPNGANKLSRFELFLHGSWKKNGLNEFSTKLQGYDRLLARALLNINRTNLPAARKIAELRGILNRATAPRLVPASSDHERFKHLTSVRTLTAFVPQVLYDILVIEAGHDLEHDVAPRRFPEIYAQLGALADNLTASADFFNSQAETYRKHYDVPLD